MARLERQFLAMDRMVDDSSAVDKLMARLERPLLDMSPLACMLERPLVDTSVVARALQPLIDTTSVLDRLLERPSAMGKAMERMIDGLERLLIDTSALDRALDGMPVPHVDPSVVAAVTAAARTVASRASDVDLDQASWGFSAAWATFVVYVATFTDGEISADVSAYVALFFVLLNGLAARRRS